jgi:hypothetical protein
MQTRNPHSREELIPSPNRHVFVQSANINKLKYACNKNAPAVL